MQLVGNAVVAGDAVNNLEPFAVLFDKVSRKIALDILENFGFAAVGISDAHPGNFLLHVLVVGGNILHLVFDMPVDALAQPIAIGAAANFEGEIGGCQFVIPGSIILFEFAQTVGRKLIGVVTLFADLAGWAQSLDIVQVPCKL